MGRGPGEEGKQGVGAGVAVQRGRARPAGAVCSTVLPEEVVTGHREGSHQHHILLEVHLPISILIELLHHLVHSIRILLGLRIEEMERELYGDVCSAESEARGWLIGEKET